MKSRALLVSLFWKSFSDSLLLFEGVPLESPLLSLGKTPGIFPKTGAVEGRMKSASSENCKLQSCLLKGIKHHVLGFVRGSSCRRTRWKNFSNCGLGPTRWVTTQFLKVSFRASSENTGYGKIRQLNCLKVVKKIVANFPAKSSSPTAGKIVF